MKREGTAPSTNSGTPQFGRTNLLRSHPLRHAVVMMVFLWIIFSVNSFRNPLTPIAMSDSNSGAAIRQLLFSSAGLVSLALLFLTRNLETVLTMNRRMLALSLLLPASVLWSAAPALTVKRSILFLFCLITLYTITYSSRKPVRQMLLIIVSSTAFIAFISIAIHFAFGQAYTVNPARPGLAGISSHPNSLAPVLSIGFILSLGLTYKSIRSMLIGRISQAFLAIGHILTTSITTLVATLVGCGLYVMLASSRYRRGALQLLIISAFALFNLIGWSNIKSAIFQATGKDESLSGRDQLWAAIVREGSKTPIFGNGFGAFWTEGKGRELVHTWNPRQSHNSYIDLWLDLGVFGCTIFFAAYLVPLWFRWPSIRGAPGSDQRRTISALYATMLSYLLIRGLGESFFLALVGFPFMSLTWIILVITNPDLNCIENEFSSETQPN